MTAIHRALHDGASYDLASVLPGLAGLSVHDSDGDHAVISFDRAIARQLIEDIELVIGLRSTGARMPLEAALIGSAQRLLDRLRDLDKVDPTAADRICAAIVSHLRSWRPQALLADGGAL